MRKIGMTHLNHLHFFLWNGNPLLKTVYQNSTDVLPQNLAEVEIGLQYLLISYVLRHDVQTYQNRELL